MSWTHEYCSTRTFYIVCQIWQTKKKKKNQLEEIAELLLLLQMLPRIVHRWKTP